MMQRVQTLWMALTVALVCVVMLSPAVMFSMGGADFRLMSYGIVSGAGASGGEAGSVSGGMGAGAGDVGGASGVSGGASGGAMLVLEGAEATGGVVTSALSICTVAVLTLSALLPLVSIFLFRNRQLQARLLGAQFALLLGAAALMGWYVLSTWRSVVAEMSDNFFFSFYPLLLVVAMVANYLAIRGVLRDEIMVRAADRIR
jgi:hypothetical protein